MKYTLTTPLYYVNDKPHIGSAYTTIACDAQARYKRLKGHKVIFITGVDEHGQKIQRTAEQKKIEPIEHCNNISQLYLKLWDKWDISNDVFIRTSSQEHINIVNDFFNRVFSSGDIYMGHQKGWYCVGCEEYKDIDEHAIESTCPIHKQKLEWRDEENLFFRLSKYQNEIEQLVNKEDFIYPISRKNEIINFVNSGLKDFSISRVNVKWGIPVKGYKDHTFYVWFDALLGYISSICKLNSNYSLDNLIDNGWPADVHVIGKDILRFHAVYWPAMLMSANLEIPKKVIGHGFLTKDNLKMGKSLGNIIDPDKLVKDYGIDSVRWYLLKDFKFGSDGDFQFRRFVDIVNNDLANTIGNLLNRTTSMSRKWFEGNIPEAINSDTHILQIKVVDTLKVYNSSFSIFDFSRALDSVIELATFANVYLNEQAPWKQIKLNSNKQLVANDIYSILETCRIIAIMINPVVPKLSIKILNQLNFNSTDINLTECCYWGLLQSNAKLPTPEPIMNKLEFIDDN